MNKQLNLSFLHDELKEVKTHKQEFLEKMDTIIPWEQLYGTRQIKMSVIFRLNPEICVNTKTMV